MNMDNDTFFVLVTGGYFILAYNWYQLKIDWHHQGARISALEAQITKDKKGRFQ